MKNEIKKNLNFLLSAEKAKYFSAAEIFELAEKIDENFSFSADDFEDGKYSENEDEFNAAIEELYASEKQFLKSELSKIAEAGAYVSEEEALKAKNKFN